MRGGGGWFQVAAALGDKRKRREKVAEEESGKEEEWRNKEEDLVSPQRNVAERKEEEHRKEGHEEKRRRRLKGMRELPLARRGVCLRQQPHSVSPTRHPRQHPLRPKPAPCSSLKPPAALHPPWHIPASCKSTTSNHVKTCCFAQCCQLLACTFS